MWLSLRRHKKAQLLPRAQFDRVRLLNEEMDLLTSDLEHRLESVTNKASFLAVAAGVLIAASGAHLWDRLAGFGVAALALACTGLFCAAVALRPHKREGLIAQRLADHYIDSSLSVTEIEVKLVQQKADVISARELVLAAQARWVWIGFGALVMSAGALTIVFTAQVLGA